MTDTWYKHSYVCTDCDGLCEITIKSNKTPNVLCTEDGQFLTLMSVVDVTINPITQTQEKETEMETLTYNPEAKIVIIEDDLDNSTKELSALDVVVMRKEISRLRSIMNSYYAKEQQLASILRDNYDNVDYSAKEVFAEIADAFGVPLTKEISVTAYVRVDVTMEVDLTVEDEGDLDQFVRDNLTVDSYSGDVTVHDWEVTRVEQ